MSMSWLQIGGFLQTSIMSPHIYWLFAQIHPITLSNYTAEKRIKFHSYKWNCTGLLITGKNQDKEVVVFWNVMKVLTKYSWYESFIWSVVELKCQSIGFTVIILGDNTSISYMLGKYSNTGTFWVNHWTVLMIV